MKTKKLLLSGILAISAGFGVNAQIINATQPDMGIWSAPNHTGLAIAPGLDVQAAVFDDGTGTYYINWIESATSTVVDTDLNAGDDPDVAYYVNADALIVGYENGGDILIDEYYLATASPIDYFNGGTHYVSAGQDPNVDMNKYGSGIITWEESGKVFACSYGLGGSVGPVVFIDYGNQPDIVVFDDNDQAAITYIDNSGKLIIETMHYPVLAAGTHAPISTWAYSPNDVYEFPRIASERNVFYGGSLSNFTVVVQDYNTFGSAVVDGFFVLNGTTMNGPVSVNTAFATCFGDYPLPVVTYYRGRVRVAWSQTYAGGCSGLSQSIPNTSLDDVFVRVFNPNGSPSVNYREVNLFQSTFSSFSRTSIASEYDGAYLVNNTNYHGGILFNDPGDLVWKGIYAGNPSYINESGISEERGNTFSLVTSPVDQTIEVLSESDDLATFQMLDNAGRVVELKTISNDGNVYSIDISHLSGGIYFLNCSSNAGQEVLRILQVTK